jgi:hypothetical protein
VCLVRKDMDINENGRLFNITHGQIHIKERNFTFIAVLHFSRSTFLNF